MVTLNSPAFVLALCGIFVALLANTIERLRRIWQSPLNAAHDAHWSVKYCDVWIWWQTVQEREAQAVYEAHVRLGPVVRIAPNEISVNDVEGGLKPIYDGRMPKNAFYEFGRSYGETPLFAIQEEEAHRQRKKMVAKPYGKTYMMNDHEWHAERQDFAADLVTALDQLIEKSPGVEMYDVFFAWGVTVMSTFLFGADGSLNLLHDVPAAGRLRDKYFSQRMFIFLGGMLPIPWVVFKWLGYRHEIDWIREMQDRREAVWTSQSKKEAALSHRVTIYDYMRGNLSKSDEKRESADAPLSAKDTAIISTEMQDHIIAGLDTSASALTSCSWLMSLPENLHWQERLREEVRAARKPSQHPDLDDLPVLNAVVKEALRVYPPGIGGLPRETTKTTVLGPPEQEVTVPAGVQVHCQAKSLHRNGVFEDAEGFHPERWLESSAEKVKEMNRWYWAFASGSRACIGENLALANMRVALATLWGDFETTVTEKTTLKMSQGIISFPLPTNGDYLRLSVRRVQ